MYLDIYGAYVGLSHHSTVQKHTYVRQCKLPQGKCYHERLLMMASISPLTILGK